MRQIPTLWDAFSLLAGGKLPRSPRANEWSLHPEQWRADKQHDHARRPVISNTGYLHRRTKL